jgi:CRISPR-associated exonuclease Cas4
MIARLDRAYEIDGELVLVEFRTRWSRAVYPSDVVELSVQRVALQDERRVRVSTTAWVMIEEGPRRERSAHRVQLLDSEEVDALRSRFLGIAGGTVRDARGAKSAQQCLHCGHLSVCELRRR